MKYFKNFLAVLFGLLVSTIILETFLHFYNPFRARVKGNKIILPSNQKFIEKNQQLSPLKIDSLIVHTKNSLGFRGEEKPYDLEKYISIIAVGGSTTECLYLSDGKDWPNILGKLLNNSFNVWINNAGLDGHSTFGHQILIEDYLSKIKPDYIIFLVGVNDVGRDDLNQYDYGNLVYDSENITEWFENNSEIISTYININRILKAQSRGIGHWDMDLKNMGKIEFPDVAKDSIINLHFPHVEKYKNRVYSLINTCRKSGIEPVFCTQPLVAGIGIDSLTGVDIETIKQPDFFSFERSINGKIMWEVMQLYNSALIKVCRENNVLAIDLGNKIPKNSLYFYDNMHFSNQGAVKVAEILYEELLPYFKNRNPQHIKQQ